MAKLLEEEEKVLQVGPEPRGCWPIRREVTLRSSLLSKAPLPQSWGIPGGVFICSTGSTSLCRFGKVSHLPTSLKSQRIHIYYPVQPGSVTWF